MTWTGYIGLGAYASRTFTESTVTGYARQAWTFGRPIHGQVQGNGIVIPFTGTSTPASVDAYAFFTASTGGTPVLVYPRTRPFLYGLNATLNVHPYNISFNVSDCMTLDGLPVDSVGAATIAGTYPSSSYENGITALASGGQTGAYPLTQLISRVTIVASAADSVMLPVSAPGMSITVINAAASNAMAVFPSSGDAINALSANASLSVAANKTATFFCGVAGKWNSLLTA